MNAGVLLDTSFLISLVDRTRAHHEIAKQYYQFCILQNVTMVLSSIVAAEFAIRQPITALPLKNFRVLSFNIPHAVASARLWNMLGERDAGDVRSVLRDDIKLLGQADHETIPYIVTEDAATLFKYCQRLHQSGETRTQAIKLIDGFSAARFQVSSQLGFDLTPGAGDQH